MSLAVTRIALDDKRESVFLAVSTLVIVDLELQLGRRSGHAHTTPEDQF